MKRKVELDLNRNPRETSVSISQRKTLCKKLFKKYKEKEKKKASTIGNAIVVKENFDTTNVLLVTINTRMMGGSLI